MIISVIINLVLFYILVKPIIDRKYKKQIAIIKCEDIYSIKKDIFSTALTMLKSHKTYMSFNDENSLYTDLSKIKNLLLKNNRHNIYAYYNFPKAFLLLGIIDFYKADPNISLLNEIKKLVDEKYVDDNGLIKFDFDKIDQVLFGLVFIKLYNLTSEEKYKIAVQHIYKQAQKFKTAEHLYLYRKDDQILFIDTLGMIVPFLVEYSRFIDDSDTFDEAVLQIKAYLNFTVKGEELPCHAYDLDKNVKLGSNNWTRGFSWFMIGLSSVSNENTEMKVLFNLYYEKIKDLREDESYWPQFFSHNNENKIDASATIMLYYAAMQAGIDVHVDVEKALKESINTKCFVENNSGDTIYINKYSRSKGKSEISQGLLLSILAKEQI